MEELLKQILEENKKITQAIVTLTIGQESLVKVTKGLAKDVKNINMYLRKGLELDMDRIKERLKVLEDNQKIS